MAAFARTLAFCCLLVGAAALTTGGAQKVTPIEKVIQLLTDLSEQIAAEGKAEAAAYDKYACFCKKEADDKLYAIETSDKKIKQLGEDITALDGEIAQLNEDITNLGVKIEDLTKKIAKKTSDRQAAFDEYTVKAQDMTEAITACEEAIAALKESKAAMTDAKLDGEVGLTQVQAVAKRLRSAVVKQPLLAAPKVLALINQLDSQAPARYEYHSNDIISVLENLLKQFKGMKKDLDEAEFKEKALFDEEVLALSNQKKFAKKEQDEKSALEEAKTEERSEKQEMKDQETNLRNADHDFLMVLKGECEEKAELWDQRSRMRAGELTAIDEALTELKKEASPNWKANKKLVGLQKSAASAAKPSASFLQEIARHTDHAASAKDVALQRVQRGLMTSASRLGSSLLSTTAMRIGVAADHFVKVRQIIKDLIDRLEADAQAEHTQKTACDAGMANAINSRDSSKAAIEKAEAGKATDIADRDLLLGEIDQLLKQVASDRKALMEATQLRAEEEAENTKTIEMSEEGRAAVEMALSILQTFYQGAIPTPAPQPTPPPPPGPGGPIVLAQKKYEPYVAPDSDRAGNTVGDLAPEVFDNTYHGKQHQATGIIGILEVVLSDFTRTNMKTTADEAQAVSDFNAFEFRMETSINTTLDTIDGKKLEVDGLNQDILQKEATIKAQTEILDAALDQLESLKVMCVEGEETWEERKAAREKEVEALKEALQILESWRS